LAWRVFGGSALRAGGGDGPGGGGELKRRVGTRWSGECGGEGCVGAAGCTGNEVRKVEQRGGRRPLWTRHVAVHSDTAQPADEVAARGDGEPDGFGASMGTAQLHLASPLSCVGIAAGGGGDVARRRHVAFEAAQRAVEFLREVYDRRG
jgi:hypothetical protein